MEYMNAVLVDNNTTQIWVDNIIPTKEFAIRSGEAFATLGLF